MKRQPVALVLCAFILLSGCGGAGAQPDSVPPAPLISAAVDSSFTAGVEALLQAYGGTEAKLVLPEQAMELSEESVASVMAVANQITAQYPYYEHMGLESSYMRYLALSEYENADKKSPINDVLFSAQEYFELIKANNELYVDETRLHGTKKLDDDYLFWVCEVVCDTLAKELPSLYGSEIPYEVRENILDLKIFENAVLASDAYLTDELCMYIFLSKVDSTGDDTVSPAKVIAHETEHLLQFRSVGARKAFGAEKAMAFCIKWSDEPVNSMFYYWLIESSAERLAADAAGTEAASYTSMIAYLDCLSLISFLSGGDVKDVPRLTQQTNLQKVFDTFGCITGDEQTELLSLLYAIEVINDYGDGFYKQYEAACGQKYGDEAALTLKAAVCQTLSKYFYRNLTAFTANNRPTLSEVFYIITCFEFGLNNLFRYSNENNAKALKSALGDYAMLQKAYFTALSETLDLTPDELCELFKASHCNAYVPQRSVLHGTREEWKGTGISAFSGEINEFLDEYYFISSLRKTAPVCAITEIITG